MNGAILFSESALPALIIYRCHNFLFDQNLEFIISSLHLTCKKMVYKIKYEVNYKVNHNLFKPIP